MNNPFKVKKCPNCQNEYEESFYACHHCEKENPDAKNKNIRIRSYKQIAIFIAGCILFQVIGYLTSLLTGVILRASGANVESDTTLILASTIINLVTYVIVSILLFFTLFKDWKEIFKSFKGKQFLFGLMGLGMLLGASLVNGIVNSIAQQLMFSKEEIEIIVNQNQESVKQIITSYPIIGFIMVTLLAPICEEITYRLGIFSFLRKINVVLAILVSALIFGLIHFGYESAFSGDYRYLVIEIIAFFNYFSAGIILGLLYHKYGFFASLSAHLFNNFLSYTVILLSKYLEEFLGKLPL